MRVRVRVRVSMSDEGIVVVLWNGESRPGNTFDDEHTESRRQSERSRRV